MPDEALRKKFSRSSENEAKLKFLEKVLNILNLLSE